eukprot:gene15500-21587_t
MSPRSGVDREEADSVAGSSIELRLARLEAAVASQAKSVDLNEEQMAHVAEAVRVHMAAAVSEAAQVAAVQAVQADMQSVMQSVMAAIAEGRESQTEVFEIFRENVLETTRGQANLLANLEAEVEDARDGQAAMMSSLDSDMRSLLDERLEELGVSSLSSKISQLERGVQAVDDQTADQCNELYAAFNGLKKDMGQVKSSSSSSQVALAAAAADSGGGLKELVGKQGRATAELKEQLKAQAKSLATVSDQVSTISSALEINPTVKSARSASAGLNSLRDGAQKLAKAQAELVQQVKGMSKSLDTTLGQGTARSPAAEGGGAGAGGAKKEEEDAAGSGPKAKDAQAKDDGLDSALAARVKSIEGQLADLVKKGLSQAPQGGGEGQKSGSAHSTPDGVSKVEMEEAVAKAVADVRATLEKGVGDGAPRGAGGAEVATLKDRLSAVETLKDRLSAVETGLAELADKGSSQANGILLGNDRNAGNAGGVGAQTKGGDASMDALADEVEEVKKEVAKSIKGLGILRKEAQAQATAQKELKTSVDELAKNYGALDKAGIKERAASAAPSTKAGAGVAAKTKVGAASSTKDQKDVEGLAKALAEVTSSLAESKKRRVTPEALDAAVAKAVAETTARLASLEERMPSPETIKGIFSQSMVQSTAGVGGASSAGGAAPDQATSQPAPTAAGQESAPAGVTHAELEAAVARAVAKVEAMLDEHIATQKEQKSAADPLTPGGVSKAEMEAAVADAEMEEAVSKAVADARKALELQVAASQAGGPGGPGATGGPGGLSRAEMEEAVGKAVSEVRSALEQGLASLKEGGVSKAEMEAAVADVKGVLEKQITSQKGGG